MARALQKKLIGFSGGSAGKPFSRLKGGKAAFVRALQKEFPHQTFELQPSKSIRVLLVPNGVVRASPTRLRTSSPDVEVLSISEFLTQQKRGDLNQSLQVVNAPEKATTLREAVGLRVSARKKATEAVATKPKVTKGATVRVRLSESTKRATPQEIRNARVISFSGGSKRERTSSLFGRAQLAQKLQQAFPKLDFRTSASKQVDLILVPPNTTPSATKQAGSGNAPYATVAAFLEMHGKPQLVAKLGLL